MDYDDITKKEPQSRVEAWLKEIYEHGGGGGDDPANTASDEDIQGIEDQIWPDGNDSGDNSSNTASDGDVNGILDNVWGGD